MCTSLNFSPSLGPLALKQVAAPKPVEHFTLIYTLLLYKREENGNFFGLLLGKSKLEMLLKPHMSKCTAISYQVAWIFYFYLEQKQPLVTPPFR